MQQDTTKTFSACREDVLRTLRGCIFITRLNCSDSLFVNCKKYLKRVYNGIDLGDLQWIIIETIILANLLISILDDFISKFVSLPKRKISLMLLQIKLNLKINFKLNNQKKGSMGIFILEIFRKDNHDANKNFHFCV